MTRIQFQPEDPEAIPLVSVVVMAYQRTEYLKITITSIIGQTMGDFELIVADDSNSPEIARMCSAFKDPRIRYIGNEKRLGMLLNAKTGMKLGRGKYIANIHDDDVLDARFLETMIRPMEQDKNIGLVFCDHKIMDADGVEDISASEENTRMWGREGLSEGLIINRAEAFFNGVIPVPSARVFRAGSIDLDELYESVGIVYDWWMSFLHCRSAFECYYVPEKLMSYRLHSGSETAAENPSYGEAMVFILSYFLIHESFPEMEDIIKKRLIKTSFNGAKFRLLSGENRKARTSLIKAFRLTGSIRCIMAYLFTWLPSWLTTKVLKMLLLFRNNTGRSEKLRFLD